MGPQAPRPTGQEKAAKRTPQVGINRLCRFDRRAIDRKCDGCPRTTDRDYLATQWLWVAGIAYREDDHAALE